MNFEVEISRTEWSTPEVWSSAAEVLRERVYGGVRVRAEWDALGTGIYVYEFVELYNDK